MDILEESANILGINSVSSFGNASIVSYLKDLLESFSLPCRIEEASYNGIVDKNIICRIEGNGTDEVVFNTHLDTVPAGDLKKWDKTGGNPYKAVIEGDKIYGLGSADVKLDYLCKLKALIKYKDREFKNPLTLLGTFGEEIGLVGADHFLKSGFIKKPKYVFVGEPTSLNIVYAHKGMIVIDFDIPFNTKDDTGQGKIFEFEGKAAHGSTPSLGKNAILEFASFLKEYPLNEEVFYIEGGSAINVVPEECYVVVGENNNTLNRKRLMSFFALLSQLEADLLSYKDDQYDPPYPVINLGMVRSYEDSLRLNIVIRTMKSYDFASSLEIIKKGVLKLGGKFNITMDIPPMHTDKDSFLIKKSLEIIREINPSSFLETKPALAEGTLYNKYGASSLVFGAGSTTNIHKPNEYNSIEEIKKSVLFYERVIEEFCL